MIRALICFVCLIASVAAVRAEKPSRVETARIALRRAEPAGLRWKHSQRLDVNCDGKSDEVFTASDQSRFYVAAVLGPITAKSRSSVVAFRLSGNSQDSFCDAFESLTPEALDATGDEPPGYRPSKTCKGLRLVAGECDSLHLYWDHSANALDWWRL